MIQKTNRQTKEKSDKVFNRQDVLILGGLIAEFRCTFL